MNNGKGGVEAKESVEVPTDGKAEEPEAEEKEPEAAQVSEEPVAAQTATRESILLDDAPDPPTWINGRPQQAAVVTPDNPSGVTPGVVVIQFVTTDGVHWFMGLRKGQAPLVTSRAMGWRTYSVIRGDRSQIPGVGETFTLITKDKTNLAVPLEVGQWFINVGVQVGYGVPAKVHSEQTPIAPGNRKVQ